MSFIVSRNQNKEISIFTDWNMFCPTITSTIRTIWLYVTYSTTAIKYGKDNQAHVLQKIDDWTIDNNNSNTKNIYKKQEKI